MRTFPVRRLCRHKLGGVPAVLNVLASPAGELLRAPSICLPLDGVEVALGRGRLLGAQGPMPPAGNPLPYRATEMS